MTQRVIVTLDQLPDYVDLPLVLYVVTRGFDRVLHKGDAADVVVEVTRADETVPTIQELLDAESAKWPSMKDADLPVAMRSGTGRAHPFDGPEVFDDKSIMAQVDRAIGQDFPFLKELFDAKREDAKLRHQEAALPGGEGDWQLAEDDGKAGTD